MSEIKQKLKEHGKTQVWLIEQLGQRGVKTNPQQLSEILNGLHLNTPKSNLISETTKSIFEELSDEQRAD